VKQVVEKYVASKRRREDSFGIGDTEARISYKYLV
jgi:hypothetical protein